MFKTFLLVVAALLCLNSILAFSPPQYNQGDSAWGSDTLGFGPDTIASAGCLMTSVTSMIAGEGITVDGSIPTPDIMNNWLINNGGFADGDLFVWSSIAPLGFNFQGFISSQGDIDNAFNQGELVILNVMNGGHYVLAIDDNGSGYDVMDPAGFKPVYGYDEVVQAGVYSY